MASPVGCSALIRPRFSSGMALSAGRAYFGTERIRPRVYHCALYQTRHEKRAASVRQKKAFISADA
jgi:hypothetical protein